MRDFAGRSERGDTLTVAFFGGSLTWGANASDPNKTSYRGRMMSKLREFYPQARWNFVDASIGGSGSRLGIFRVDRDVLQCKPDLVFLDFTLNDNAFETNDDALNAYEGILRRILQKGKCPIIPVFLASRAFIELKDIEVLKRRTSHIALAEHYGLNCADVVAGMRDAYRAGKLNLDLLWPPELFDATHPHDEGYAVYAEHVWNAFIKAVGAERKTVLPDEWLFQPAYATIARVKISDLKPLPKGWKTTFPEVRAGTFDFMCSRWMDNVTAASNCVRLSYDKFELAEDVRPEELRIKFKGENVLLFGESTIHCGKIKVKIDGKVVKSIDAAAFGRHFSPSAYLAVSVAENLDPEAEHTLTIVPVLSKRKPQQIRLESICIGGKNNIEFEVIIR